MHAGLVSTIIPVYNRQDMLVDAVESVISQTYRPIEIIIVNDGSTDSTLNVAKDLANKYDEVTLINELKYSNVLLFLGFAQKYLGND